MIKKFFIYSSVVLTATMALIEAFEPSSSLEIGSGYRKDRINWKIQDTNVFGGRSTTKLKFHDQDIFLVGIGGKTVVCDCIYVRGCADYGWISNQKIKGETSQKYPIDPNAIVIPKGLSREASTPAPVLVGNEGFQFSEGDLRTNGSHVFDASIGIGYPIEWLCGGCLHIAPVIGYSYHEQKIRYTSNNQLLDEEQTVIVDPKATTTTITEQIGTSHIAQQFRSRWYGPWVGLDLAYRLSHCLNILGAVEYHFARASTNTHINNSIVQNSSQNTTGPGFFTPLQLSLAETDRFRKTKNANGLNVKLAFSYNFSCEWFANLGFQYQDWTSNKSDDHLDWRSFGVGMSVGRCF